MAVQAINDGIFCIDIQHPDRKMFDCIMPTEHGTTYNAYVVKGQTKSALIDTADPDFTKEFMDCVDRCDVKVIDYVIILHTEQDHSGSLPVLMKKFPNAQIVATEAVAKLMVTHLHIGIEKFHIVSEGDQIDLGGRSLTFIKIPFAHWPDNTMVYESTTRTLFSSDLFGSHYASDKIFATNSHEIKVAARAYFAEIMMPFSAQVRKYTEKVIELAPSIIATAHGPIWNQPSVILQKYMRWTSDQVEKTVVVPFVSMHGSSALIAERLCLQLASKGISVLSRNLGKKPDSLVVQSGLVMRDLVTAAAVVFVMPTVLGGPHPAGAYCSMLMNAMRVKTPFIGLIGSYGWGTRASEIFAEMTSNLKKAERLPSLQYEGLPTEEQLVEIDRYADELAAKIFQLGDRLI
ncbi:MAG: FprA family A-type flavoprotein [Clostridiaceae bacterium]|nr:FprA family A-type flavoprotein [Clostridiaceae bacterium]